jgi:predicted ArsR family transcriptional regulator
MAGMTDVSLTKDRFLRSLLGDLTGVLQDVIGVDEASGFVSVVAQRLGDSIGADYHQALRLEKLDRTQLAAVLVDLKRRINGDFYVIEETDERIVLGNRRCPFGDDVRGRESLCMMTSGVFGTIAASSFGWSKVALEETIAKGAPGCRVVVYLQPDGAAKSATGQEYFAP